MGIAKRISIEMQESPWLHSRDLDDKYVCCQCIGDKYLRKLIRSCLESKQCTYCKKKSKKYIASPLRELIGPIYHGLRTEWEHPEDVLFACDDVTPVYESIDLSDELQEEAEIENTNLVDDILNELSHLQWCKHPADNPLSYDMSMSWEFFVDLVKHHYRYTFFQIDEKDYLKQHPLGEEMHIRPREFLEVLGRLVKYSKNMIKPLPKNHEIYRVRLFESKSEIEKNAERFGPPPKNMALAGRMSPSGIPVFYGSFDKDTALSEIENRKKDYKYAVIAKFKLIRSFNVLSFISFPNFVSLFDPDKVWDRRGNNFLREFAEDISKPIKPDKMDHPEYVPTQMITEYFRYIFKYKKSKAITGMLYNSSKNSGGTNCVLFITQKNCIDVKSNVNEDNILQLVSTETIEL